MTLELDRRTREGRSYCKADFRPYKYQIMNPPDPVGERFEVDLTDEIRIDGSDENVVKAADNGNLSRIYFEKAMIYPLLTPQEEKALGLQMRAGRDAFSVLKSNNLLNPEKREQFLDMLHQGRLARTRMILSNTRLVVKISKYHYGLFAGQMQMDDIIQAGNLGLVEAVDHFDPEKGKFSDYSPNWIVKEIWIQYATEHLIRKSLEMTRKIRKFVRQAELLKKQYGNLNITEIAEKLNLPLKKAIELDRASREHISLDQIETSEDYDGFREDPSQDTEAKVLIRIFNSFVREAVEQMDEKYRVIFEKEFWYTDEPVKDKDLAPELGISRAAVSLRRNNEQHRLRDVFGDMNSLYEMAVSQFEDRRW